MTAGGRDAVLAVLRRAGSAEAGAIAERLGLHPTTVRVHLDALVADGLATRASAPSRTRRGRPPYVYAAATEPASRNGYEALAAVLASALGRGSARRADRARAAGRAWAQTLGVSSGGRRRANGRRTDGSAVSAAMRVLDQLGFEPRRRPGGVRGRIEMWNCPYLEVARAEPDVTCAVHQGLLEGLLEPEIGSGIEVELVPFATPDYCVAQVGRRHANAT